MVCANSSTKTKNSLPSSLQIRINFKRNFFSAVVAVVHSHSSVQFDTVCSVFSHHTLCLLNSGDEQSTPIHSAFFFLYLQMFLFWFREWIISIFMSFQHMFSVLFIYFIFFALYRRFVYLCFVLSRAYFFSDKLCWVVYTFCMLFSLILRAVCWLEATHFVCMWHFFSCYCCCGNVAVCSCWFSFGLFKLGRCKSIRKIVK